MKKNSLQDLCTLDGDARRRLRKLFARSSHCGSDARDNPRPPRHSKVWKLRSKNSRRLKNRSSRSTPMLLLTEFCLCWCEQKTAELTH